MRAGNSTVRRIYAGVGGRFIRLAMPQIVENAVDHRNARNTKHSDRNEAADLSALAKPRLHKIIADGKLVSNSLIITGVLSGFHLRRLLSGII